MNVILAITSVSQVALADGVTAGAFRFSINPVDITLPSPDRQETSDLTATFADVAPGDYVASVVRIGSDGGALATAVTANFTVPAPDVAPPVVTPVMADVPASLTVSLA